MKEFVGKTVWFIVIHIQEIKDTGRSMRQKRPKTSENVISEMRSPGA